MLTFSKLYDFEVQRQTEIIPYIAKEAFVILDRKIVCAFEVLFWS